MYLDITIFTKYWQVLKKNYQDKTHDKNDFKLYYSILREYSEKDFIQAIKMVLKYNSYFPRIDEIVKYLPKMKKDEIQDDSLPDWMNQKFESQEATSEEIAELESLIEELTKGSDESQCTKVR